MSTAFLRVDAAGVAVEAWTAPEGKVPADCFHASIASAFKPVTNGAVIGWVFANGTWAAPSTALPTVAQLLAHLGAAQERSLERVFSFDLGTPSAPLIATTRLDSAGLRAMDSLAVWAILNSQVAGAAEPYSNVDFSALSLAPLQALALATKARAVQSGAFAVLNGAAAEIRATPPTITTLAEINALVWPAT